MAFSKILVGVDGSAHNELVLNKAADFAADIANENAAQVVLVYAISPHALSEQELAYAQERCGEEFSRRLEGSGLPPFPIDENDEQRSVYQYIEARKAFNQVYAEDVLKRAKSRLQEHGIEDIKSVIENNRPANAILDVAKQEDVDLIIIGRRGHSRVVEFFLGSTAQKVLQQTNWPVLVVE